MNQQHYLNQLTNWYKTPLGIESARAIKDQFDSMLKKIFGYYLLDLGVAEQQKWLQSSVIRYQLSVNSDLKQLAIANESIDCALMCHSLECYKHYYQVLSEAERILLPGGKLLIVGFNPRSLWGVPYYLSLTHQSSPWNGYFHTAFNISQTLNQLGFEIHQIKEFFYRPPINHQPSLHKLLFLEKVGPLLWPYPGGIYAILAEKKVAKLIPIKPIWGFKPYVVAKRDTSIPTS